MYPEFFVRSPLLALPIGALVLFLVSFGGVIVSALSRKRVSLDAAARMPLEDGEVDRG